MDVNHYQLQAQGRKAGYYCATSLLYDQTEFWLETCRLGYARTIGGNTRSPHQYYYSCHRKVLSASTDPSVTGVMHDVLERSGSPDSSNADVNRPRRRVQVTSSSVTSVLFCGERDWSEIKIFGQYFARCWIMVLSLANRSGSCI